MNRTGLYVVIAILVAALVAFGIYVYNEQNKPGLEVRVDGEGLSIEGNG